MREDQWDEVIDTNLKSAFWALKACLPHMQKQKYGRVVITSSITGPRASVTPAGPTTVPQKQVLTA